MFSKKIKWDTSSEPNDSHFKSNNDNDIQSFDHAQVNTFINLPVFSESSPFWSRFYDIECRLNIELKSINFWSSHVSTVYNPIEYAADLHCNYLRKFLKGPKSVLFIGMNPGPYGMVQTGVISDRKIRECS